MPLGAEGGRNHASEVEEAEEQQVDQRKGDTKNLPGGVGGQGLVVFLFVYKLTALFQGRGLVSQLSVDLNAASTPVSTTLAKREARQTNTWVSKKVRYATFGKSCRR